MTKSTNSKFWLLGAAYWVVVATLLGAAVTVWPSLGSTPAFFYGAIAAAVAGSFAVVALFRPKS